MSRLYRVRFARLATAISLTALTMLTLAAAAGAKPIVPAVRTLPAARIAAQTAAATVAAAASTHAAVATATPLRTPSPEPGPLPRPTSASGDLFPSGAGVLAVIAALAVATLLSGVSFMVSRGPSATRRVRGQKSRIGTALHSPSAGGPAGRAA